MAASRQRRVKTTELNKFVERVAAEHPPASPGKGHVRILYAAQTGVAPPTFVFFTNVATTFHFSYQRFLENRLARGVRLRGNADPDPRARAATNAKGTGSSGSQGSKRRRTERRLNPRTH